MIYMNRLCFTMIELVFVIVVVGILSAVAIPRLMISRDDACYVKLRTTLNETEIYLSREYTKKFLQGSSVKDSERIQYLKEIEKNNDANGKCGFKVTNANNITATINKNTLALTITTDQATKFPTISCDLNKDQCKSLLGRQKSK